MREGFYNIHLETHWFCQSGLRHDISMQEFILVFPKDSLRVCDLISRVDFILQNKSLYYMGMRNEGEVAGDAAWRSMTWPLPQLPHETLHPDSLYQHICLYISAC